MGAESQTALRRADALRNRDRVLDAAERMLERSPSVTLADIATAAGVSRSTVHRRFGGRDALLAALRERPQGAATAARAVPLPPGRLGRERPVGLDALQVVEVVPPARVPEQLVAEAQRIAKVPVALYVLDIDGTRLLHVAGPTHLPATIDAPLAVGPELDADGISALRRQLADVPGAEVFPLWLRGRPSGVMVAFGHPAEPLGDVARQGAAATILADRYTDALARTQRRKQAQAAAEIQQSLLPPRIVRVTSGEVAGHVLPSYEVAGDWFDVVENLDGVWITLADGAGSSTRAAAAAAVALGALRASRRSGSDVAEALVVVHQTLRELPGWHVEMPVVAIRWDPVTAALNVVNCGHVPPAILRRDGDVELLHASPGVGLGGRSSPKPAEHVTSLTRGDRLVIVSGGVVGCGGGGQPAVGVEGTIEAALRSKRETAADTVRQIHRAVLATGGELRVDATAVCLSVQ